MLWQLQLPRLPGAADTLLFTGNADGAAADTYFNKVSAAFGKETEACCVNYVACANFYAVAVMFANPCQSNFLPFAVTFGRVDAEYVNACVNQCRYAFCVVAGVNACAYDMAFFCCPEVPADILCGLHNLYGIPCTKDGLLHQ